MIVPIRLCEIKRRIEVCAAEEVETVGEVGFASTSCSIMSAYAYEKENQGADKFRSKSVNTPWQRSQLNH
jgi:hypothetical protein